MGRAKYSAAFKNSRRKLHVEALESRVCLSVTSVDPTLISRGRSLESTLDIPANAMQSAISPVFLGNGRWAIGPTMEFSQISSTTNIAAADTTNSNQLWQSGGLGLALTGAGVQIGVWDGGPIRATHQELNNRVTVVDTSPDPGVPFSTHATHVAGTLAATGVTAASRGMANGATVRSRDFANDDVEFDADLTAGVIDLSNHSYGFLRGWVTGDFGVCGFGEYWFGRTRNGFTEDPEFGKYDSAAQSWDSTLHEHPSHLSIWSAGNDRGNQYEDIFQDGRYYAFFTQDPGGFRESCVTGTTGWFGNGWYLVDAAGNPNTVAPGADGGATGFDTLPQEQTAKNALAVGAAADITADPYQANNITVTSFSSFGPTDDGRIKPDVVANGFEVFSTEDASNSDYGTQSGTSMAAPNVTGTAALLLQHYRNLHDDPTDPNDEPQLRSASLKGTLIHTAFDAGNTGPDYQNGWGLVDAAAAANFLTASATPTGTQRLLEKTYSGSAQTYNVVSDGTGPLKVSIVWTDPAPTTLPGGGLDDATSTLVNDLDIWVTKTVNSVTTTYYPWTLNPASPNNAAVRTARNDRDNVEQVLIDSPTAGTYTIHVGRDPGQSTFTQDYSLMVSGIDAPPQVTKVWIDYSGTTASGNPNPLEIKSGREENYLGQAVSRQFMPARIGGVFDTIKIEFSEAVNVQQSDLVVSAVTSCTSSTTLPMDESPGGFSVTGNVATWKFNLGSTNPQSNSLFHSSRLLLDLDADSFFGVVDLPPPNLTATSKLDGDWINPTGVLDVTGNDQFGSGDGIGGKDFKFRMNVLRSDINRDGATDGEDIQAFIEILSLSQDPRLKQFDEGDINSDGYVDGEDIQPFIGDLSNTKNFSSWPVCEGEEHGQSLLGGAGGGGEEMMGGGEGGGEEMMGGGESLLSGDPARIYFTTSGSTSGGGALPGTVPGVELDGPGDSATLYVWVSMGDYALMRTMALDVYATDENIVKATASSIHNPDLIATEYDDEFVDTRWLDGWVDDGELNPDGDGDAALVVGARAGAFYTGYSALHDDFDGTDEDGMLDEGYDATNDAFLLSSVTLQAMAGSAGLSTDIVLHVGAFKFLIGNGTVQPLLLGLGTNEVDSNDVGATDGTAHATITVAAEEPESLVMRAGARAVNVVRANNVVQASDDEVRASARALRAITRSAPDESRASVLRAVDLSHDVGSDARAARRSMRVSRAALRLTAVAGEFDSLH